MGKYFRRFLGKNVNSYLNSYLDVDTGQEVDTISGACLLARRQAVEKVGLFDENFFMYREDVDLCLRVRRKGYKIYLIPDTGVIHYGGSSFGGRVTDVTEEEYKSRHYYYNKNYGEKTALFLKIIVKTAMITESIYLLVLLLLTFDKRKRRGLATKLRAYLKIAKLDFASKK